MSPISSVPSPTSKFPRFPILSIDQVLLQALITKTVSFRSSEGWLPVCISDVKADAFLHLYVGFVTEETFVFFVTTANNPDDFDVYSRIKDRIYTVGDRAGCEG